MILEPGDGAVNLIPARAVALLELPVDLLLLALPAQIKVLEDETDVLELILRRLPLRVFGFRKCVQPDRP